MPGDGVQDFATALNKLSQTGNFGNFQNIVLRNQFVARLSNTRLQTRLLETADLNYEKALQSAMTVETSEKELVKMNQNTVQVKYIHASKKV